MAGRPVSARWDQIVPAGAGAATGVRRRADDRLVGATGV